MPTTTQPSKNFEAIKQDTIQRCKEKAACEPEFRRILAAENLQQLLQVLIDNLHWCLSKEIQMIDGAWLEENFGTEMLWKNHVYTGSGNHSVKITEGKHNIFTCDSSQVTVETRGSSQATVETRGSSQATVNTWGSSQATVKTWGSSQATVETRGSSQATVETWDSSQATVETWDSSQATVKTRGSSTNHIACYQGSKIEHSLGEGNCPIIKHLTYKKVYVKVSDFEIVQVK